MKKHRTIIHFTADLFLFWLILEIWNSGHIASKGREIDKIVPRYLEPVPSGLGCIHHKRLNIVDDKTAIPFKY